MINENVQSCRVGQPPSQELRRLVAGGTNQTVVYNMKIIELTLTVQIGDNRSKKLITHSILIRFLVAGGTNQTVVYMQYEDDRVDINGADWRQLKR